MNRGLSSAWGDRLQALKNIPPVLKIVWRSGPSVVTWGLILRVFVAAVPVAMPYVAKKIIDTIVALHDKRANDIQVLWWWVAIEVGLAISNSLLSRGIDYTDALLADRYTRHVSIQVMEHASQLDLADYENPLFYDRLERARVQATDRLAMIQAIGRLILQVMTTIFVAGAILWYSPWLLLLIVVCLIPAFLGESHFAFLGYAKNLRQTPAKRQMDYLRQVGGSKESAKEVKLFGLSKYLTDRFRELADAIYVENVALFKRRLLATGFLSTISTIGYYSAYVWVVYRTARGELSLGDLTFLTQSIATASSYISQVFSTISGIADQALFLTDLLAFFGMKRSIVSKPNALPAPRPIKQGFEFRNITFRYPGTERKVLDGLDFRIEPGERIALIGENGQGKTTIVKLMSRLYDPTEGQIFLDGVDIRDYDIESICNEIGVIFQDFMRYEMTARENIAVGRIDEILNDKRIREAAYKSLAEPVIERMPLKYEQQLGRRFEGGVDLSGGEWQKLGLARAYLREAQVLILDEPTAALDARSEFEVFERFAELTLGKMALLISHRFSTVRMADRIIVLENGRISEDGNHTRLIAAGGRYAEMFELQASSYR